MIPSETYFEGIISPQNLFAAWEGFKKGKQSRKDVQEFESNLEGNIFQLHRDLQNGTYCHDSYHAFTICDPKQRSIHKATVRDRIVHHAVFTALNPIFEPRFIAHSFSCRKGKRTHKGVFALEKILRKVSSNYTGPCFALKCDVHQFFKSVDHDILLSFIKRKVQDTRTVQLVTEIISSFPVGIPIGNLTSQLFANIYMNEFDQFIKHKMRLKNYIRYTDDFVIVSDSESELRNLLSAIELFLNSELRLKLHPHKVGIRKYRQGIDFLGYVIRPHHRVLRTVTKRRIFRQAEYNEQSLQSYLGVLSHSNSYKLQTELLNRYWLENVTESGTQSQRMLKYTYEYDPMNERQSKLLAAIIDQFIETAVPVGSKKLLEVTNFDCSSATVRNEMFLLEDEGFLEQPHVSAGRVPTAKGYRSYVKEMMEPSSQEQVVRKKFASLREQYFQQKDQERVYEAVALLANMIPNVAFASVPHKERVYFMGLSNVLKQPEFQADPALATGVVEVLEEHLHTILDKVEVDDQIRYYIGEDHILPQIQSCSLMVTGYKMRDELGVIGILGPIRMDYAYNTVALDLVADLLCSNV